jgi:hypothetical protein
MSEYHNMQLTSNIKSSLAQTVSNITKEKIQLRQQISELNTRLNQLTHLEIDLQSLKEGIAPLYFNKDADDITRICGAYRWVHRILENQDPSYFDD